MSEKQTVPLEADDGGFLEWLATEGYEATHNADGTTKLPHEIAEAAYKAGLSVCWADRVRIDWLENCGGSHAFVHEGYGDYTYYTDPPLPGSSGSSYDGVRDTIDQAMADYAESDEPKRQP